MNFNLLCTDCARVLGVEQELLTELPHLLEQVMGCDNCGRLRMLKSLEDYGITTFRYDDTILLALASKRKTHRAVLDRNEHGGIYIKVLGPQPVSTTLLRHLAMCGML